MTLLTGPAGAGKTALMQEVASLCEERDLNLVSAQCRPLEQEYSFGVALDLFERARRDAGDSGSGGLAYASTLFEDAGAPGPPKELLPLLYGLYLLVVDLSEAQPLVLAIDDAHWADVPSLRFLSYMAGRVEGLPVAMVIAYRSNEADAERAELLDELESMDAVRVLRPAPLSPAAVTTLIRRHLRGAETGFCRSCERASAGNPFLLRELLLELGSAGLDPTDANADKVVRIAPERVRMTTAARLGRLGPAAQEVARVIAVLNGDASTPRIAALTGRASDEIARDNAELARAAILAPGATTFEHPLLASAVYTGIPEAERRRLQARIARLLIDEGVEPESVAAHLLESEPEASEDFVHVLRAAGADALSRGAPASAAKYLRRALEERAPGDREAAVLLELGVSEILVGDPRSVDTLERAVETAREPLETARALHALARARYLAGDLSGATECFLETSDTASGFDRELELEARAAYLQVGLLVESELPKVLQLGPTLAAQIGPSPLIAPERAILGSASLASSMVGEDWRAGVELAERALDEDRLLEQEGADGTTLYSVTGTLSAAGLFDRSEALLDQAVESARRAGSMLGFATASYSRAHPRLGRGAVSESIADVRAAIDTGWEQYLPVAYGLMIDGFLELDRVGDARKAADELDLARWGGEPVSANYFLGRGRLLLAEGRPEDALRDFERVPQIWPIPNPAFFCEWRSRATEALIHVEDRDRAAELAAEELGLARSFGAPRSLAVAMRALGLAQGGREGIDLLTEAVGLIEGTAARLEYVRALTDLGGLLRRSNLRAEARERLREAVAEAQRLGLPALERRAGEELKLAGGRPRRRHLHGVESLTPGELRVARMAAVGMTNREIAGSLFVTVKAVQWHLGNCYRKLAINSREALAGFDLTVGENPGGGT